MKFNTYIAPFFLILIVPLFFLKKERIKTDKVQFVKTTNLTETIDTLQLYELIDNKWEKWPFEFQARMNEAYCVEDSIEIRLNAGFLGGYAISLSVHKNEFTSRLVHYDCTFYEELIIIEQELKLIDCNFIDRQKLKGIYYCKANSENLNYPQIKIKVYFEMALVDVTHLPKLN